MQSTKQVWAKIVSRMLKSELKKRGMTYADLSDALKELCITLQASDLTSRISKGTFSAILFMQCLKAMQVKTLLLDDIFFEEFNTKSHKIQK